MAQEDVPITPESQKSEKDTNGNLAKNGLIARVPELIANVLPDFKITALPVPPPSKKGGPIDLLLALQNKDHLLYFAVKVNPLGYPSRILRAIATFKQMPKTRDEYPVIVTDQISKEGASLARQMDVGYLDLAGNCYLKVKGLCIEKTALERVKRPTLSLQDLFSPKATRVLRTLIEFGPKSWAAVELAKLSNVSVGYVYKVVRKLSANGFAQEENARIQFREPFKLLKAWAQEYHIPSSQTSTFLCPHGSVKEWVLQFEHAAKQEGFEFMLTLDTAISLLTASPDLEEPIYLYTNRPNQDSSWNSLGLKPAAATEGNIHILRPYDEGAFHHKQIIKGWPVVSRTQLYLDLFQKPSPDNRVIEFLKTEQNHFEGKVQEVTQKPIPKKEEDCSWRLILSKTHKRESKHAELGILTKKLKLSLQEAQSILGSRPIILFDQKTKQEVEELGLIFNQEGVLIQLSNNPEDAKILPRVKWPKNVVPADLK